MPCPSSKWVLDASAAACLLVCNSSLSGWKKEVNKEKERERGREREGEGERRRKKEGEGEGE